MKLLRLLTVSAACALPIALLGCAHHHPHYDHYEYREHRGYWEYHPHDRGDWDRRHWERHGRWDDCR